MKRKERTLASLVEDRTHELNSLNEELRQADQLKSQLLGIAAHDLRNPLQSIVGQTELLKAGGPADPAGVERLESIQSSAEHMARLVDQLLDAARLERGEVSPKKEKVDLSDIANQAVIRQRPAARRKGQRLEAHIEPRCTLTGNRSYLEQILDNLLSNAVKFSFPGGTIQVRLSQSAKGVLLEVADAGPGLSSSDQSQLFQKFRRLTPTPTGGETSTGLGLFIARELVRSLNGRIWVTSEEGSGSSFFVELPEQPPT
jgi:signal transduction histidine kinase